MQYDGVATVHEPPQTVTFDPANRRSSLGSRNRVPSSISASSSGPSLGLDIPTLSAVKDLFSSVASIMRPDQVLPAPLKLLDGQAASPTHPTPPEIFNTPSKLTRFLEAAENNGIPGVHSYHLSLSLKGYGSDIMYLVNTSDLIGVGVSPGDAIRLKEYALRWWTEECQRVAKWSRAPDNDHHFPATATQQPVDTTPPNKRLRFEKRFHDGGMMTTYGPNITKGSFEDADYDWWVYSKDLKTFVPLPPGKVPVIGDDIEDDVIF